MIPQQSLQPPITCNLLMWLTSIKHIVDHVRHYNEPILRALDIGLYIRCAIIKIILNTLQATVRSRLAEFQEENNSLRSKISVLEVASYGATEQEKLIGKTLFHSTMK